MKTRIYTLLLPTMAALAFVLTAPISGWAQESHSAKAARLMNDSGFTYTKASETVWTVPFEGKALKNITVAASVSDDVLTVFAIVAEKKNVKATPEMMKKLLGLNEQLDRVKIGLDKEGDVFVRIDLSIRILDKQELKENLDQVAAAANDVFAALKPFWIVTK